MTQRRRTTRSRSVLALAAVVLLLSACQDWPALGYDASRSGYNPAETTVGVGNVAALREVWSAKLPDTGAGSAPVVAGGSVFVASGRLRVFSAHGSAGCGGSPRLCEPIWTAAQGGTETPTVAGATVFTTAGGSLYAFDARGATGCSGAPKTCAPLWRAPLGGRAGSPAVSGGMVYVGTSQDAPTPDLLYAFDVDGSGCSGNPKVCQPQWTSAGNAGATPAVANGLVFAVTTNLAEAGFSNRTQLSAFDAEGQAGCAGTPVRCKPRWRYDELCSYCSLVGPPSIAGGRVRVLSTAGAGGESRSDLLVFDAAGVEGCTGPPRRCEPIDEAMISDVGFVVPPVATAGSRSFVVHGGLSTFEEPGLAPGWTIYGAVSPPSIANGVVYVSALIDGKVAARAFDAEGVVGCSDDPVGCAPRWSGIGVTRTPAEALSTDWAPVTVADGTVFARVGRLRAYRVPA